MSGSVTLVGGGPGDPGLITVAGLAALSEADVVLYDHLAPLACLESCRADVLAIDVGKLPRGAFTPQERINELLVQQAQAGRRVVRLKGGDNFVFGRGGEELEACLAAGVSVSVIPGVTSAVAAPALAGIPVTHRGLVQGFTVLSGHLPPDDPGSTIDWAALARANTTIVILMGVRHLAAITATLSRAGLSSETPAAVIADAGSQQMAVVRGTLASIAGDAEHAGIQPPATTVIGQVAALDLRG